MTVLLTIDKSLKLRNSLCNRFERIARGIGVHNALGARIAEKAEIDFLWLSGLELSTALGFPDASLITMTELIQAGATVSRSTRLPLLVDADTGFGSVNNVRRLVQECEQAGISGICIEDKKFPKVNSFHTANHTLEAVDVFEEKLLVAIQTRTDPNFMVVARTEAMIAQQPVAEAVLRANSYRQAGADAVFVHSRADSLDELNAFFRECDQSTSIIVSPTTYWSTTEQELKQLGASAVLYSNVGLRLAVKAMIDGINSLTSSGSLASVQSSMISLEQVTELQEVQNWKL